MEKNNISTGAGYVEHTRARVTWCGRRADREPRADRARSWWRRGGVPIRVIGDIVQDGGGKGSESARTADGLGERERRGSGRRDGDHAARARTAARCRQRRREDGGGAAIAAAGDQRQDVLNRTKLVDATIDGAEEPARRRCWSSWCCSSSWATSGDHLRAGDPTVDADDRDRDGQGNVSGNLMSLGRSTSG